MQLGRHHIGRILTEQFVTVYSVHNSEIMRASRAAGLVWLQSSASATSLVALINWLGRDKFYHHQAGQRSRKGVCLFLGVE